jgi:hypothetical protein
MRYVLNRMPDIEKILIGELKNYFSEEIRFEKVYPNFGNVRIGGTHPFAFLIDQEINGNAVPTGLFPSVTIVNDTEQRNPETLTSVPLKDVEIGANEVTDIEANRDYYSISNEDLNTLKDLTSGQNKIYGQGVETFRRASFVAEIWSENPTVKNKIYDLVMGFLTGKKRIEIHESYGVVIIESSVSGEKSGNYNFDFGKVIYGGIIRFTVDYGISQYIVEMDEQTIVDTIEHFKENIHHGGST